MSNAHNDIFAAVNGKYLLLHRENYVDQEDDVRAFLRPLADHASKDDILALLEEVDWRMKLVGIYLIVSRGDSDFTSVLAKMLSTPGARLVRRPICIALAILHDLSAVDYLSAFLEGPHQADSLHDYVAVIETLHVMCPNREEGFEQEALERIRNEGFDDSAIVSSRERFLMAVDYWRREREE